MNLSFYKERTRVLSATIVNRDLEANDSWDKDGRKCRFTRTVPPLFSNIERDAGI